MSSSTSRDSSRNEFQSFSDNSDSESLSGSSSHDIDNGKEEIVNYVDSVQPVPIEEDAAEYLVEALHCL